LDNEITFDPVILSEYMASLP